VSPFDPKHVQEAIARLPHQSNATLETVLSNARPHGIEELIAACQRELRVRGSLRLSAKDAEEAGSVSARVAGKSLQDVIVIAFTEVPAGDEELWFIEWIGRNPDTSYQEASLLTARAICRW
jgi:hypothetical protein